VECTAPEDPWRGYIREHGYASSTPICDGKLVYVFFGKTGVLAFDLEGHEIWRKNLGTESSNRKWGSAASPILYGNLLLVNASEESRTIYALDKTTGKEVWKIETDKTELTYNTPALVNLSNGAQEMVIAVPNEVWGFNPDTGDCTWWATTELRGNISPSVLGGEDVVYVFGGYPKIRSTAIRAGGKQDVTDTHTLWTSDDASYVPSPVEHDGHLYWVNERGLAYCMEAETGKVVYKEKLEAKGTMSFYASVVLANDKLYAVSRKSGTFVLAAKPTFELISHNLFDADTSDFNGSPAVSHGRLFLRSNKKLYCIKGK
jgi:outer membrane protein assembly factor BamB